MKSILDEVTMGSTGRANAHDPVVAETDGEVPQQVLETAVQARATNIHVNLHVTDWVATQWEDLILKTMIEWTSNQKVQDLKHLLGDATNTGGGYGHPSKAEKANALSRSPLSLPHTGWRAGVCSPQGSSSGYHEWMSHRCWTPESTVNAAPTTRPVLVDQHMHTDAESD